MGGLTRLWFIGLLVLFASMWFVVRRNASENEAMKWVYDILPALYLLGVLVYAC
jgi:hypothetical protein